MSTDPTQLRQVIRAALQSEHRRDFIDPEDFDSMTEDVASALESEGLA